MTRFDDTAKRRIRYLTRRGLLELDILLKRFMAEEFNCLNDAELATFAELLNLPDQDFFAQVNGQLPASSGKAEALLQRIRAASSTNE